MQNALVLIEAGKTSDEAASRMRTFHTPAHTHACPHLRSHLNAAALRLRIGRRRSVHAVACDQAWVWKAGARDKDEIFKGRGRGRVEERESTGPPTHLPHLSHFPYPPPTSVQVHKQVGDAEDAEQAQRCEPAGCGPRHLRSEHHAGVGRERRRAGGSVGSV